MEKVEKDSSSNIQSNHSHRSVSLLGNGTVFLLMKVDEIHILRWPSI